MIVRMLESRWANLSSYCKIVTESQALETVHQTRASANEKFTDAREAYEAGRVVEWMKEQAERLFDLVHNRFFRG